MDIASLFLGGSGSVMTSFFSLTFLIAFLPVSLLAYAVVPHKAKKFVLLIASLVFFWLVSSVLIVYLFLTILSVFLFGKWLDKIQRTMKEVLSKTEKEKRKEIKQGFVHRQRMVLLLAVILHVGLLLTLKYSGFFADSINSLLSLVNAPFEIPVPKLMMPIGISFFTLQAVSYITDVYHGLIKADGNILRISLFISFFPQIVEGPICRYSQTADQLWNVKQIEYKNLTFGLQRILYGMMKKIVIADRLDPMVKAIFDEPNNYHGGIIFLGAVCYTIQLYMDFSGSMDAVMGIAEIFGVKMPENFERPFFSKSVSEFWKRWHITLGTWFKDYIFYPVTSTKKMKNLTSSARKKLGNHYGPLIAGGVALFCVWFCNGLWHGAGWNYIFFGMYHFVLILGGNMITPLANRFFKAVKFDPECFVYRLFRIIRTALLVVIGELFFRSTGLMSGFGLFGRIVSDFSFSGLNSELLKKLSIDPQDFIIIGITLVAVFIVSLMNEKGISLRDKIAKRGIVTRWCIFYALILFIIIFGAYGFGYIPVDPMYANF